MSGGSLYEIYKVILVNAAIVLSTFAGVEPENLDEECVLIYLQLQQKSSQIRTPYFRKIVTGSQVCIHCKFLMFTLTVEMVTSVASSMRF